MNFREHRAFQLVRTGGLGIILFLFTITWSYKELDGKGCNLVIMDLNVLMLPFAVELFFEDDDDEIEGRTILHKVPNFAESVVPNFNDRQFQQHFRMRPTTFENLLIKLKRIPHAGTRISGNPEVTLEKQVLIALWYLANIESFRSVADRFGVSKSTTWVCLYKICRKLLVLNVENQIISFPSNDKCNQNINDVRNKTGFPGVVGAIDGSHIPILAPKDNAPSYMNRKGFHSILLQGTCNNKKIFIDCYTGEAGSIHDACMFRRSELCRRLQTMNLPQDGHLLGDSAYPLSHRVMVPYKDNGHLTNIQTNYNIKHSKARVIIEQSFALLKGRFRRLKLCETARVDLIPLIILSACILHNICLLVDDIPNDLDLQAEINQERIMNHNIILEEHNNGAPAIKRDNIANAIFH